MAKHKVDITGLKTTNLKVLKNEETVELLKEYRLSNSDLVLEKIIMGNMKLILSNVDSYNYNELQNIIDRYNLRKN